METKPQFLNFRAVSKFRKKIKYVYMTFVTFYCVSQNIIENHKYASFIYGTRFFDLFENLSRGIAIVSLITQHGKKNCLLEIYLLVHFTTQF